MGSKKDQFKKELDERINELDKLSNPTKQERFKFAEDFWAKLRVQGVIDALEDKVVTEKYVQGNLKASEFLSLIWENHPE